MTSSTRFRAGLVVPALVLSAAVTVPSVAAAEPDPLYCSSPTCRAVDPVGDAPPRADIVRLRATQSPTSFSLRLKVRHLPKTGRVVFGAGRAGWGSNFVIVKRKSRIRVREVTISEVKVYPAEPCPTAKVVWNQRRDIVRATFPMSCAGGNLSETGLTIVNGVDFRTKGARDSIGHVFYQP